MVLARLHFVTIHPEHVVLWAGDTYTDSVVSRALTKTYSQSITVGVIRNETLVFVNFSAQDASILKISVPIIKRRS